MVSLSSVTHSLVWNSIKSPDILLILYSLQQSNWPASATDRTCIKQINRGLRSVTLFLHGINLRSRLVKLASNLSLSLSCKSSFGALDTRARACQDRWSAECAQSYHHFASYSLHVIEIMVLSIKNEPAHVKTDQVTVGPVLRNRCLKFPSAILDGWDSKLRKPIISLWIILLRTVFCFVLFGNVQS